MNFVWCRLLCCIFDDIKKAYNITLLKINEGVIILFGPLPLFVPDPGPSCKDVPL